jgi:hypothetical protein
VLGKMLRIVILRNFVPSVTTAKCFNPISMPEILPSVVVGCSPSTSVNIDGKYFPEGAWLIVTVFILLSIHLCILAFIAVLRKVRYSSNALLGQCPVWPRTPHVTEKG